jgi:ATP-binding cassette subfamily C protein
MIDKFELRRLFSDIWSVVGWRYIIYLLLLIVTGMLEGLSIASMVPLLTAIGIGGDSVEVGRASLVVYDVLSWLGLERTVPAIALLILGLIISSTFIFLAQAYIGIALQTRYVASWQLRLLQGIFSAKWALFQKKRSGEIINSVVTEAQMLGGAYYQVGLLITGLTHCAIYLIIAAALSMLTTVSVLVTGIVLFAISRPLVLRAYKTGESIVCANAELQVKLGEFVGSAKLLKATATEDNALNYLAKIIDALRRNIRTNAFDVQVVKGIFDLGAAVMIASILVISAGIFKVDAALTLVILAIFVRLMPKLTGLQQSLQSLISSMPIIANLQAMLHVIDCEVEKAGEFPLPQNLTNGPIQVKLRNLTVKYGDLNVLSDISINIPAGSCIAIVGRSGVGKSTLVDAIMGLVPLTSGSVNINGVELSELPLRNIRRRVGYMGQETLLYNATIRENILWGQPNCTDEDLIKAVTSAAAFDFISALPNGFDTLVGDRGGRLSGGERQRIGLARALLGSPGLLILDEAASALDVETDASITKALESLKGDVTMVVISHRLSSVQTADRIYVIDNGKVVESGSWSELSARKGKFTSLL